MTSLACMGCGRERDPVVKAGPTPPSQEIAAPSPAPVAAEIERGALPDEAAKALDAAIQHEYCRSDSFTANALRMLASGKRARSHSHFVEATSFGPMKSFTTLASAEPTLRIVAPNQIVVRGRGDGTDIQIVGYERLVVTAEKATLLGDLLLPQGAMVVRKQGNWVRAL